MGAFGWVGQFARDLRFGVRGLAQVRGFSAIAIGSLALGIGGSTAMYSRDPRASSWTRFPTEIRTG